MPDKDMQLDLIRLVSIQWEESSALLIDRVREV